MHVDVRVLGKIKLFVNDSEVNLGDRKQRLLLANLAIERRLVEKPQIIERLWPEEEVPENPAELVYNYVNRIRAAFTKAGVDGAAVLATSHNIGYELKVAAHQVDYHRFRALRARAEVALIDRRADEAARLGRLALAEWGSPAGLLGGTPLEREERQLQGRIRAMQLDYRATLMLCLDAEMRCGQHRRLLPELALLAADDYGSDDQELARLRMLAHFRSGQKKEAIMVYVKLEDVLSEKHGSSPDEETKEMHRQIKKDDEALNLEGAETVAHAATGDAAAQAAPSFTGTNVYQTGEHARSFVAQHITYNEGSDNT
ncbi:BTAD domain-containing putative transcriptional regulator [Dactylosporangium sp. NPDC006015]|uniref:AfsR/SARP family transcriptional regulator n=1 Tax=Dactylosporangium sp. NPDC006015 TaxID=3154576 RepID=UPI0033AC206F